jgi:threonine/homoserine/homoserine lactone efflux protein
MTQYLTFVVLVAVLVLIPGPAVILVMQKAVTAGSRSAVSVAAGVLAADLVWAAAAAGGVTAVLVASEPAFVALRLIGAAYLIYIGVRLLFARPDKLLPITAAAADRRTPQPRGLALRQGFLCDMTNPKTVLVFTSVIPQFLHHDGSLAMSVLLGVTFALLGFFSLLLYGLTLGRAGRAIRRPRLQRHLLRGSGGILIGFGGALAAETS